MPMFRGLTAGYCSLCGAQLSANTQFGVPAAGTPSWTAPFAQLAEHHAAACGFSGAKSRTDRSDDTEKILAQAAYNDNRDVIERQPMINGSSARWADLRVSAPGAMSGPKQPKIPELIDVKVIENTPLPNQFKGFNIPAAVGRLDTDAQRSAFKEAIEEHTRLALVKHRDMTTETKTDYGRLGVAIWPFVMSARAACTLEVDASIPKAGHSRHGRARARVYLSIAINKARYSIVKQWVARQQWGRHIPPVAGGPRLRSGRG
jgi:hypothetical protein